MIGLGELHSMDKGTDRPNFVKDDKKKRTKKPLTKRQRRRRLYVAGGLGAIILGAGVGMAMVVANYKLTDPWGALGTIIFHEHLTQPENILLIGNNARNPAGPLDLGTGGGQADIMMVAHIDPINHQVTLISLPRDCLFAMPQYSDPIPKLKSFFFIGAQMNPNQAAQLTVNAVEKFTGMHMNFWVATDFNGFSDAINAIGGIRIDIPGRILDLAHSGANFYPGWQTLNGAQALAYIRVRQNTASNFQVNDYERYNAQAQVLKALKNKLLNSGNDLAHLPALLATWKKDVATNMSTKDLLLAAKAAHGAKIKHFNVGSVGDSMQVVSAPAPGINQENYITGAYYDIIDSSKVTAELKPYGSQGASTGIPLPSPSQVPVQLYSSQVTYQKLKAAGYSVTYMGSGGTYPAQVMYPPQDLAWGLQVGRTLATGNSLIEPGSNANAVVVYAP